MNLRRILLTLLLALLPLVGHAAITEGGVGILYGPDHAFSFQAPPGWMLDNESGVNQGLHAVFYPKGTTWADAATVAYARAAAKDNEITDVPALVRFNVDSFHQNGSPKYQATFVKEIPLARGKRAVQVYHFTGDAWGNYEAVGYVDEARTIDFVVLSCRSKKAFDAALPAFEALLASYQFLTDKVKVEKSAANGAPAN